MTIYPILFIIFLCGWWTYSAFEVGKETPINFWLCVSWALVAGILLYLCGFFNVIHWPQIIWMCLMTIGCVISFYWHNKTLIPTPGNYFISLAIHLLLYRVLSTWSIFSDYTPKLMNGHWVLYQASSSSQHWAWKAPYRIGLWYPTTDM